MEQGQPQEWMDHHSDNFDLYRDALNLNGATIVTSSGEKYTFGIPQGTEQPWGIKPRTYNYNQGVVIWREDDRTVRLRRITKPEYLNAMKSVLEREGITPDTGLAVPFSNALDKFDDEALQAQWETIKADNRF